MTTEVNARDVSRKLVLEYELYYITFDPLQPRPNKGRIYFSDQKDIFSCLSLRSAVNQWPKYCNKPQEFVDSVRLSWHPFLFLWPAKLPCFPFPFGTPMALLIQKPPLPRPNDPCLSAFFLPRQKLLMYDSQLDLRRCCLARLLT